MPKVVLEMSISNKKVDLDRVYIAHNIKARRLAKKWTQETLAFESNTTRKLISDLELGKRNAQIDTISRVAHALGCNLSNICEPTK